MRNSSLIIAAMVIVTILISGCHDRGINPNPPPDRDYRQDMRDLVQGVSAYAKGLNSNFIIIPQNGHELLTENGEETGTPAATYLDAIDGVGREDLFYGYNGSYIQNATKGYISFAAGHRELNDIPAYPANPYNVNASNVTSLTEAKNFLYLINPGTFPNKDTFLNTVRETNYDIIIIDLFYDDVALTASEVVSLKVKANGGSRLVIAYMSIGEAEDYRYYWHTEWETNPPLWLAEENLEWPGNYKVRYWDKDWHMACISILLMRSSTLRVNKFESKVR